MLRALIPLLAILPAVAMADLLVGLIPIRANRADPRVAAMGILSLTIPIAHFFFVLSVAWASKATSLTARRRKHLLAAFVGVLYLTQGIVFAQLYMTTFGDRAS